MQRQGAEERVAAADHRGMGGQRAGQRAEAVVEQQHAAARGEALLVQVLEQVFVGGVEGLQRVVALLGLAQQVEAGEGGDELGHGRAICAI
ncbi:hypothetical protein D3C80_1683230 [compost metagenome]